VSETQPWLESFDHELLRAVSELSHADLLSRLNQESSRRGLVTGFGKPLQFVVQSALPHDQAYEAWIAKTGSVPTRDNRHDRLNALIWLTYPKSKARLNQLQADTLALDGVGSRRGACRDAMTLCDENLLIISSHALKSCDVTAEVAKQSEALIRDHHWTSLFMDHRAYWNLTWKPFPFGHALIEKLDQPYKAITAHVLVLNDEINLDQELANRLCETMTPRDLLVLPVMGIPGWDGASEEADFYDDSSVFRPSRRINDSRADTRRRA
jgi:hypothetical protein